MTVRHTIAALVCVASIGIVAHAQQTERTIRDQVYSDEQATRGQAIYNTKCSDCHNGGMGPSLTTEDFLATWDNKTLRALYSRIISTMPSDEPGSLSAREVLDVVAYLMRANRFPVGAKALDTPDELNSIKIVRDR